MPHNVEAERAILGAVLLGNHSLNAAAQVLASEDFFSDANRLIYEAMAWLSERSKAIDMVTLREELVRRDVLERAGGAAYISSLSDGIPEAANVDQYARIVKSAARRRRMIEVANAAVIEAMERGTDTDEIIERLCENLEAVRTDPASRGLYLVRAADIDAVRVNWAWDGRVALGALSLFVGDPGLGKTTAAVEVAARVSKGDLPGDLHGRPVPVLIATAEDALTVLRARLEAARADLNKVSFVVMQRDGLAGSITLPDDVPELQRRVEQERARLVIIDPIMGHLSGKVDSHRDASLRRALAPLCRMAEATDAAVIGIAHLNKSQVADLIRRVGGSVALSAAARSVLLLTRDPDDDTEEGPDRVLAHGKCNLGPQMEPLRLRIEGREVIGPDGPIPTSGIEWLGTAEGVTVTDMLGSATEGDHRKLLRWIQKRGGRTTERELARGPRHYRTSGAAATALEELVAMGAGEWHEPDRTWSEGGRPTREFVLADSGDETSNGDRTQYGDTTKKTHKERGYSVATEPATERQLLGVLSPSPVVTTGGDETIAEGQL